LLADRDFVVYEEKGRYDRPIKAFKGEIFFTSALLAVTSPKPINAYVLQGHGEHDFARGDEVDGYLDFTTLLAQNMIRAELVSLRGTNDIPADCDLLIVAGPRSAISTNELEKISRYLDGGGRMFALFNSASTNRVSGLERILSRWNVIVGFGSVQDPVNSQNTLRAIPGADVSVGAFSEHPAVKPLLGYNLNLILPRPVGPARSTDNNPDSPKVTVLFQTEKTATLFGDNQPRSYPLAVAVERAAPPGVSGRGATRMIVVGDSFFLGNGPMKIGANRDFADYALNWLVERSHLVEGVGPKSMTDYRITLTASQMSTIQWLLLGGLPGAILLLGTLVWLRRLK
jgi:hypothetical protein